MKRPLNVDIKESDIFKLDNRRSVGEAELYPGRSRGADRSRSP